ncbi:hypothetical protein JTB14_001893 [Gonioctena quinquepunctata]|nr:hypothetical protein JTB14_001893 [Gonioctena quinquepunctata]
MTFVEIFNKQEKKNFHVIFENFNQLRLFERNGGTSYGEATNWGIKFEDKDLYTIHFIPKEDKMRDEENEEIRSESVTKKRKKDLKTENEYEKAIHREETIYENNNSEDNEVFSEVSLTVSFINENTSDAHDNPRDNSP